MYKCKACGNDEFFMGFFVKDIKATNKEWVCVKCGEPYDQSEFSEDDDKELCNECCDKAFEINEKIKRGGLNGFKRN